MSVSINKTDGKITSFMVTQEDVNSFLDLIKDAYYQSNITNADKHYRKGINVLNLLMKEQV